ncbi:histone-lysine N-methyltransferase PRDM9-like [Ptychodera flava]|uniref:histone-lysine N-methyltransferase PRDM9-like n=1 Tax=Ptychodera flava TaxID=63121 RepID=UPI00396A6E37
MFTVLHDAIDTWCSSASPSPEKPGEQRQEFATRMERAAEEERELVASALLALHNSADSPCSSLQSHSASPVSDADACFKHQGEENHFTPLRLNYQTSAGGMDEDHTDGHSSAEATYTLNFNFVIMPDSTAPDTRFAKTPFVNTAVQQVAMPDVTPPAFTHMYTPSSKTSSQEIIALLEQLLPRTTESTKSGLSPTLSGISGVNELSFTSDSSVTEANNSNDGYSCEDVAFGESSTDSVVSKVDPATGAFSSASTSPPSKAKRKRHAEKKSKIQPAKRLKFEADREETKSSEYECIHCHSRFTRVSTLTNHLRTHTGEKPFVCNVCDRGFAQKGNLVAHARTHQDDKQFHCNTCGKGFTQNSSLKTHLRIHTGERPYQCAHCHLSFSDPSTLRKHVRVHTGEKPYICEFPGCKKVFSQSGNLKRHERIHQTEVRTD